MIAIRLPQISLRMALLVSIALALGAALGSAITPKLTFVTSDVKFEQTVPLSLIHI